MAAVALRIDIVSDIVCPWCYVGYGALKQALKQLEGQVDATIYWHAYELNPDMPPGGELLEDYLYRVLAHNDSLRQAVRQEIEAQAALVGVPIDYERVKRVYNTFDAHRLLLWAGATAGPEAQTALQEALFEHYFEDGDDPCSPEVLLTAVVQAGLDTEEALAIIDSDIGRDAVQANHQRLHEMGITSVPAWIINEHHWLQGALSVEEFVQVLNDAANV